MLLEYPPLERVQVVHREIPLVQQLTNDNSTHPPTTVAEKANFADISEKIELQFFALGKKILFVHTAKCPDSIYVEHYQLRKSRRGSSTIKRKQIDDLKEIF